MSLACRVLAMGISVTLTSPALRAATWERALGSTGSLGWPELTASPDGGVYVYAYVSGPLHAVTKLDAAGSIVWSRSLDAFPPMSGVDYRARPSPTRDGGLLFAGQGFLADDYVGAVMKWDAAGNSTGDWTFTACFMQPCGCQSDVRANAIHEAADGSWIVAGRASDRGPCGSTGSFVAGFTPAGTRLWRRSFPSDVYISDFAELAGGGFLAVGGKGGPATTKGWAVRLGPTGGVVWEKSYSVVNIPVPLDRVAPRPGGFVLGGTEVSWLLEVDANGDPTRSRRITPTSLSGLPDGSAYLIGGSGTGLLARLDPSGAPVWSKEIAGALSLDGVAAADGGLFVAWRDAGRVVVSKLDPSGEVVPDACGFRRDVAWTETSLPVTALDPSEPETISSLPQAFSLSNVTVPVPIVAGEACCVSGPPVLTGLRAVKRGDDVGLDWGAAPAAFGYNVWTVADRRLIDQARQASAPPAVGVAGCSAPSPAPVERCTDPGAIGRGSPGVLYYQVRGACTATTEGP